MQNKIGSRRAGFAFVAQQGKILRNVQLDLLDGRFRSSACFLNPGAPCSVAGLVCQLHSCASS